LHEQYGGEDIQEGDEFREGVLCVDDLADVENRRSQEEAAEDSPD